jgi:SAM-dependent methyltransferase
MVAPAFDRHADTYDKDLNQALSLVGEKKDYFARERVRWLAGCLSSLGEHPRVALDYGCGIGDTSQVLREFLQVQSVIGLDISTRSLQLATSTYGSDHCLFSTFADYQPCESVDLVYCNGVFHHIPPPQRDSAIAYVYQCLRPGGLFALWENNPWNPGTRFVMQQCVFDHDAVTISPPKARGMLRKSGFAIVGVHYRFFFPRFLKSLRFLEARLARFPLGGQYQVLCRKPGGTAPLLSRVEALHEAE